jgi:hypothetical protein
MTGVAQAVGYTFIACAVWAITGAAMLVIPNTPHANLAQAMRVLDSFRSNPESAEANEAFDEFLRISHQTELVESTLLPAFAAIAVTLTSLIWQPLSARGLVVVIVGFSAWLTLRTGLQHLESSQLLGMVIFSAALVSGQLWARRRNKWRPKAPRGLTVAGPDGGPTANHLP